MYCYGCDMSVDNWCLECGDCFFCCTCGGLGDEPDVNDMMGKGDG